MFQILNDKTICITRGDAGNIVVAANDGENAYSFAVGDVVRFKVFQRKNVASVLLQKDSEVTDESGTVTISLTSEDTKIGESINKPTDYWYEIELNPNTYPQTIIGYDNDGEKIFRLFPEGGEVE